MWRDDATLLDMLLAARELGRKSAKRMAPARSSNASIDFSPVRDGVEGEHLGLMVTHKRIR